MLKKSEFHHKVEQNNLTLVAFLSQTTGFSKAILKGCLAKGAVWMTRNQHTQRVRRVKKILFSEDEIHLYYDPKILNLEPQPLTLVNDCIDYSIWYKPSGTLSQGSKWSDHCTVSRWVEQFLEPQRPAFIVHRLDKAANGLIIIAHTKKVATLFSQMFADKQIHKTYRAKVKGLFPDTVTITDPIDQKVAVTHVQNLHYDASTDVSLVSVNIETGRKHQIRIHLFSCGFPIIGDRLHGNIQLSSVPMDLQLSSTHIGFTCPLTGESKYFTIPKTFEMTPQN